MYTDESRFCLMVPSVSRQMGEQFVDDAIDEGNTFSGGAVNGNLNGDCYFLEILQPLVIPGSSTDWACCCLPKEQHQVVLCQSYKQL